jgi:hypothetical protein
MDISSIVDEISTTNDLNKTQMTGISSKNKDENSSMKSD